jgi:hypothetical protein
MEKWNEADGIFRQHAVQLHEAVIEHAQQKEFQEM